jgi:hypothetical protein
MALQVAFLARLGLTMIPSMRTRCRQVYAGRCGWSAGYTGSMRVGLVQHGCCTLLLHAWFSGNSQHLPENAIYLKVK